MNLLITALARGRCRPPRCRSCGVLLMGAFIVLFVGWPARGDDLSVGPSGVNALVTGLSGDGVGIGQLELGRPGDGFGDGGTFAGDAIQFVNTSVVPFRVYNGTASAAQNEPLGTVIGKTANGSTLFTKTGAVTGPGPDILLAISDSGGAIPAGTVIQSVAGNGNITMSAAATATVNPDTLTYSGIDNHAEGVAGVIISKDQTGTGGSAGVAPTAFLQSSFYTAGGQQQAAVTDTFLLQQGQSLGHPIVAINMSFGAKQPNGYTFDGSQLLTQYVDWSARANNVLYVISGNENPTGFAIPTDNFNAITVSFTKTSGGVFNTIDGGNVFTESPANGRSVVALTAPGRNVNLTGINSSYYSASGTSFAAPHVTGGDAQLNNYLNNQVNAGHNEFADARFVPVQKAILLNSADKLEDAGDGLLLGMDKTITRTNGVNYLNSPAYGQNHNIALDPQMGSGQLNVERAITQAAGGEFHSLGTAPAGVIGWDSSFTIGDGDTNSYVFDTPLEGGSYVSATLAWNRLVNLVNNTGNPALDNTFTAGDTFNVVGLTDLHLLLETVGPNPQIISSSISDIDSVQQIFFPVPATGNYQLVVQEVGAVAGGGIQSYGLAWWAVAVPEPGAVVLLAIGAPLLVAGRRMLKRR